MKAEPAQVEQPTDDHKTIWVFTPSRTDPKDLESILVQRHKLLQDAVERVRESALTDHKHHLLFVGPRGCGKTHLITLIVSRLGDDAALEDRLRIAWLNEDETCTTLLELLVKIHSALEKRYPAEFREDALSGAYEMEQDAALDFVSKLLLTSLGSRVLLVVAENLDAIFDGLGDSGQKQLRAFIQENSKLSIVATAQRLVEDLSDRASPFFGFFQTEHLKPLNIEEATELLQNIARLQKKQSVVEFLATPRGRSRVRALHHLSGGNHRIYIVLSQFITRDSIDALIEPFMKMVDELTPYYQERIRWLPQLQRKIVEFLCGCESTVPVKEIAKRLFATPQTISSQLQDLREKGYVEANQRGRESLYEASEPLMRICIEVKDAQNHQPLRLLVDFLRVWYDDYDLKVHLGKTRPASTACAYLEAAISRNSFAGDLRKQILLEDFRSSLAEKLDPKSCYGLIRELAHQPEETILAMECWAGGDQSAAIHCLDEAISRESNSSDKAVLPLTRAALYAKTGDRVKGIDDYTAVIDLPNSPAKHVAMALVNRAFTHYEAGETQRAIDDFTIVIGLPDVPEEGVARVRLCRGIAYWESGQTQSGIEDFTAVISLPGAPVDQIATALVGRGTAYCDLGQTQKGIEDFTAVISLPGAPVGLAAVALVSRGVAVGRDGDKQLGIADYTAVVGLPGAPVDAVARALVYRGFTYGELGQTQQEIDDYTAAMGHSDASVELRAKALVNRGMTFGQLGKTQQEIDDYTAVIGLSGAPVQHVAVAMYLRAVRFFQGNQTQQSLKDLETLIRFPDAPTEVLVDSYVALAELHFSEAKWGDGVKALELGLENGAKKKSPYFGRATDLIGVIFAAGLAPEGRFDRISAILGAYNKRRALSVLGEALVQHIGAVFRAGEPFPSADNLDGWASTWEIAAENVPDFQLPIRLLRTAVAFIKAGGNDRGPLLDLTSTERAILEQGLGLV